MKAESHWMLYMVLAIGHKCLNQNQNITVENAHFAVKRLGIVMEALYHAKNVATITKLREVKARINEIRNNYNNYIVGFESIG